MIVVDLSQLDYADSVYLEHTSRWGSFPSVRATELLAQTLEKLGIQTETQKNIQMVVKPKSKHGLVSRCFALSSPHDVKLVVYLGETATDVQCPVRGRRTSPALRSLFDKSCAKSIRSLLTR